MRQATYTYPARREGRARTILLTAALVILAAGAAVALYIAVSAWSAAGALTTENRHLRDQLTSVQAQERADYAGVGHMIAPILPYTTQVCSQDLTGPSGPAAFYFVCTNEKPAQPAG